MTPLSQKTFPLQLKRLAPKRFFRGLSSVRGCFSMNFGMSINIKVLSLPERLQKINDYSVNVKTL